MSVEKQDDNTEKEENFPLHIIELKNRLNESWTDNNEEILDAFAENYLMPENLWWSRFRTISNTKVRAELGLKAVYHFCYDFIDRNKYPKYKFRDLNEQCFHPFSGSWCSDESDEKYLIEEAFKYPHKGLKLDLMSHERFCVSPIPKETIALIEKMEKLYEKIIQAKTVNEKVELMLESNNVEFIKQNIEMELCNDLNNKWLWKFYIKYLKEADPAEMLQVYSKYCRYFLDDDEMIEEYKNEVEKAGGVKVPWKNPFDFECVQIAELALNNGNEILSRNDKEAKDSIENVPNIEDFDEFISSNDKELNGYYDYSGEFVYNFRDTEFRNILNQNWPFKAPLMQYIMSAANPSVQQKFQQTCKYFFSKQQIVFCYRFLLINYPSSTEIIETSITCNPYNEYPQWHNKWEKLKQKIFHITTVFELTGRYPKFNEVIKNNIYKCEAKYVTIFNQSLTEGEFLFLVGHGGAEDLRLANCDIKKEDGEIMMLEEILEYVPKLRILKIKNESLKTNNTLSKLKFENKLYAFQIKRIANELNPDDFCNFIKQFYIPITEIKIDFQHGVPHQHLKTAVKKMAKEWIPQNEKPYISCKTWVMEREEGCVVI